MDKVTQILNAGILSEATGSFTKDVNGQDVWRRGDVLVELDDLQRHMDSLRQNVMVLCSSFEEGNPDFVVILISDICRKR